MDDIDGLQGLQSLHQDLLALVETRLPVVERLWAELEAQVEQFRKLLDKTTKNDTSRSLDIDDVTYSINEEFKQQAIEIADALDLDEVEAAKLFLLGQQDAQELDRSPLTSSIIRFHKRRQFLLESLRLALSQSLDDSIDETIRIAFRKLTGLVLDIKEGEAGHGSHYWRKCISELMDIEQWLNQIAERVQTVAVVGQEPSAEFTEIMDFQRSSLIRQHESLGAIAAMLIKGAYTTVEDFRFLLTKLKALDRHDSILTHYLPIIGAGISHIAPPDSPSPFSEARSIHQVITAGRDYDAWTSRNLHTVTLAWWLAEYAGRFTDTDDHADLAKEGVDPQAESEKNSGLFAEALKDGAFHFLLSMCRSMRAHDWEDPIKQGLCMLLLHEGPGLTVDVTPPSPYFSSMVMESLQSLSEALISNMPDTIRKLRSEEYEQRKLLSSRLRGGPIEGELHIERFMVIMSYSFAGFADAAQSFWESDSNLYGFLQWASKRQTTPWAAAYCELFRSISETQESATLAHQFLLDEGAGGTGRIRRSASLSWAQLFNELDYYANFGRDKTAAKQSLPAATPPFGNDQVEQESSLMLQCYLRLFAHLCKTSDRVREWVLSHPQYRAPELLLSLSSNSQVEGRLRACAFNVLTALLVNKVPEIGDGMWTLVDNWFYGKLGHDMPKIASALLQQNPPSEQAVMSMLSQTFEESTAFVDLLTALIAPYHFSKGLNDTLPFPENLGTVNHMPGIDIYVDFAVGKIFGTRVPEVTEPTQARILRLTCLSFMATALSTFNEDLVVFANKSKLEVDAVMDCSSLAAYCQLHPFARVMEWLFNDRVLAALFTASHESIDDVNNASPDSPLILSLMQSLRVMDLVMTLQVTYLDVVRPLIKTKSSNRSSSVRDSAIASFEDAVLNNLQLIVDLGLYCGTGHQDLTITALRLLSKLSSARKLTIASSGFSHRSEQNKVIGILQKDNESERIARSLTAAMAFDFRELEAGTMSPGYTIKEGILSFLESCIDAAPNRPTVGHLLLGFSCEGSTVGVVEGSPFAMGTSLFHAIMQLSCEVPESDGPNIVPWLISIRRQCTAILQKLWKSSLTSSIVIGELRLASYLTAQALNQMIVNSDTLWDGKVVQDPDLIYHDSAIALRHFLDQRAAYLEYVAADLHTDVQAGLPTHKARTQSSILGLTVLPTGEEVPTASIFDLFDFVELDVQGPIDLPPMRYLTGMNYAVCLQSDGDGRPTYLLNAVTELILLKQKELGKAGHLVTQPDVDQFDKEMEITISILHGRNQYSQIARSQDQTLRAWSRLMVVTLRSCVFEPNVKSAFILQALQVILPKIAKAYSDNAFAAIELAGLGRLLLQSIDFKASASEKVKTGDFSNDKLFQLFQVALDGIHSPVANSELREICYQICYTYLKAAATLTGSGSTHKQYILRAIRSGGNRLTDTLCDDAYAGIGTCRTSALVLLDSVVSLMNKEHSKYLMDGFVRLNFINILVDGIRAIPHELRATLASDIPLLLSYYESSLSLLLRISQTRMGATHVFNAGLFDSVRASYLFSADPDIGLEMDNTKALKKFFELMLAVIRIINAVVLSRGTDNQQTTAQARQFLKESRPSIVGVFKRHAKIAGISLDKTIDLSDLVDNFALLITATKFMDFEDEHASKSSAGRYYS